jgi:hypothetical protein
MTFFLDTKSIARVMPLVEAVQPTWYVRPAGMIHHIGPLGEPAGWDHSFVVKADRLHGLASWANYHHVAKPIATIFLGAPIMFVDIVSALPSPPDLAEVALACISVS